MRESNLSDVDLTYAGHFDLDDAALRAAIGGMGMVLSADFMIHDELAAGRLCPLPDTAGITLGYYVIETNSRETSLSRRFVHWLKEVSQSRYAGVYEARLQQ